MVDPLDGTVNYLYELDTFSVSVAAEDAVAGVLVGVVYEPARDVLYTAARGRGAHKQRCGAARERGGAGGPRRCWGPGSATTPSAAGGRGR